MTVKELKDLLAKYADETLVSIQVEETFFDPIEVVEGEDGEVVVMATEEVDEDEFDDEDGEEGEEE